MMALHLITEVRKTQAPSEPASETVRERTKEESQSWSFVIRINRGAKSLQIMAHPHQSPQSHAGQSPAYSWLNRPCSICPRLFLAGQWDGQRDGGD